MDYTNENYIRQKKNLEALKKQEKSRTKLFGRPNRRIRFRRMTEIENFDQLLEECRKAVREAYRENNKNNIRGEEASAHA